MVGSSAQPRYRVVISGYYGFDNLGDELILQVLVQELKKRGFQLTILSQDPGKTKADFGVNAVHRMNLVDVLDAFAQGDLLISGGGGLFQDVTGMGSVLYYGTLIHIARFFEMPIFFWGQGIGPLKGKLTRFLTRKALEGSSVITVRDYASAELAQELTGHLPEVTADPVWLLDLQQTKEHLEKRAASGTWNIGLSLRSWHTFTEEQIKALAYFFKNLVAGSDKTVRFLLFRFQEKQDRTPLTQFEKALKAEGVENVITYWVPTDQILENICLCHCLFGMRFHSLVLGILASIPVYGLVYDPKVHHLLESLRLQGMPVTQLETLDEDDIREYFSRYKPPIIDNLRERAAVNFQRLDELLRLEEIVLPLPSPF